MPTTSGSRMKSRIGQATRQIDGSAPVSGARRNTGTANGRTAIRHDRQAEDDVGAVGDIPFPSATIPAG
jgi:hypothetical protein